jgi:hypothetical protein
MQRGNFWEDTHITQRIAHHEACNGMTREDVQWERRDTERTVCAQRLRPHPLP